MPAPRHVVLNALYLAPGVSGGPETYLRGLAPALAREQPQLRLTIATTPSGARSLGEDGWQDFAELLAFPCEDGERLRRQWCEQVLLPRALRRSRADLVHSLANIAPVIPRTHAVVTLHDVTFLRTPTFSRVTTWGMGALAWNAAHRADALICSTAAARAEICAALHASPSAFSVVPLGHEPTRTATPLSATQLRAQHALGDARVVLCVAAKRPHKNQAVLVEALRLLADDVVLVLAGHAEPYELELRELARARGVQDRVRFVGYVPDDELEGLWALAACAAFPTLGEGFGIPVLEALAHGVPIACSDLPVLREVGGTLPHYFDPHHPGAAARAIEAASADTETASAGPAYAARFTWAATARGTYEAYERALGGR